MTPEAHKDYRQPHRTATSRCLSPRKNTTKGAFNAAGGSCWNTAATCRKPEKGGMQAGLTRLRPSRQSHPMSITGSSTPTV